MNITLVKKQLLRASTATLGLFFSGFSTTGLAAAETASANNADPFSFSVEQLMNIQVTSVSKKPQLVSETASAIYVITQDDIRQSGARNIPEALRMAPGVQVAQIDANKWAVTVRGFNGQFANKLLVMIDGRTIYNPGFSGVYWDTQDTLLSDIERIEVIRGPGGTIWGANAVNGVINVITKAASETQGGLVAAAVGTHENLVSGRVGGKINDNANYRMYGKYTDHDGNRNVADDSTNDDWQQARIGGRIDWHLSDRDQLMFTGEGYIGESGETMQLKPSTTANPQRVDDKQDVKGIYALSRWDRTQHSGNETRLQAYVDFSDRDGLLYEATLLTLDIEAQHRIVSLNRNDFVMGLGYRRDQFDSENSQWIALGNTSTTNNLIKLFIQDEIELIENKLSVTLGTRIEHNELSENELDWLPSIRGAWQINPTNSVWSAVTRALRTPSLVEKNGSITDSLSRLIGESPALPFPLATQLTGNQNQESEELISYELGYRTQPTGSLSFDFTVFYNDYDNLRSIEIGTPNCQPTNLDIPACLFDPNTQFIAVPLTFGNNISADGYGAELAFDWLATSNWRLFGSYSYLDLTIKEPGEPDERSGDDPEHQLNLQSQLMVRDNIDFDVWLRYTDELDNYSIEEYWALDSRIAWRVRPDIELALIGKNLLKSSHLEYGSELEVYPPVEIERSFIAELSWSF